jgi:hypothetical protein
MSSLPVEERQRLAMQAVFADSMRRRLFAPAEAINVITVGAVHADASTPRDNSKPDSTCSRTPAYRLIPQSAMGFVEESNLMSCCLAGALCIWKTTLVHKT